MPLTHRLSSDSVLTQIPKADAAAIHSIASHNRCGVRQNIDTPKDYEWFEEQCHSTEGR